MKEHKVSYIRYLVIPISKDGKPMLDDRVITTFAEVLFDEPLILSLPSYKEGLLNIMKYQFILITEEEYETYVEFDLFPERDSDDFLLEFKIKAVKITLKQ